MYSYFVAIIYFNLLLIFSFLTKYNVENTYFF